jgi:hypothetical protein
MFRLSSAIKGEPFSYKDLTHNTKEAFRRTLCKLAPVELARLELDGDDVPERLMQELDRNTETFSRHDGGTPKRERICTCCWVRTDFTFDSIARQA